MLVSLLALVSFAPFVLSAGPASVRLYNAAEEGMTMPAVGIGTGGYGPPGETWNDASAEKAVAQWLDAGGRRIDTSLDYRDQTGIGRAVKAALDSGKVKREDVFLVSKVGGGSPGYNETFEQIEKTLVQFQVAYVDLLLIHWPGLPISSTDPNCQKTNPDAQSACRKSTWMAMQEIFKKGRQGGARAIGVSNFEVNHLQDVMGEGDLKPAVNQVEFHPYWHEDDLVKYCFSHNITFNGYSPLGSADIGPILRHWNGTLLQLPLIKRIAQAHGKSPAQVLLRWDWQQGIPVNPRSQNPDHMKENLAITEDGFELTDAEMNSLSNVSPKPANPKVCPDPHNIP